MVIDISNLGSLSSNLYFSNVKDYDKYWSDLELVSEIVWKLDIGNFNINSISNKFNTLKLIIQGKVDVLVITENKTDSTFPVNQFILFKAIQNLTGFVKLDMELVFLYISR